MPIPGGAPSYPQTQPSSVGAYPQGPPAANAGYPQQGKDHISKKCYKVLYDAFDFQSDDDQCIFNQISNWLIIYILLVFNSFLLFTYTLIFQWLPLGRQLASR